MVTLSPPTGLPGIFDALRRRWLVAVLVAVPVIAGSFIYTQRLPNEYDGVAIVGLSPRPTVNVGADTLRVLAPTYVAYVGATRTLEGVAERRGLSADALSSAVDASVANDTATLRIRVRLRDPARVAQLANDLAAVVVTFSRSDKLLTAAVVSPATTPTAPARPQRHLLEAAGVIAGLLLAVAVAVAAGRVRPRVRTADEISELTGHPVVARLPSSKSLRPAVLDALDDPVIGAGIRSLRTHLDFEGRGAPVRALAVTSSVASEGKSSVSALLAASMARLDANVLLIDADLHHPSGVERLGIDAGPGLAKLLRGEATFSECVLAVPGMPQLSILPAVRDPDGGDLLARRFFAVLGQARGRYDLVIIDSPPLLAGDAARTLVRQADGVVLVVKAGVSQRQLLAANRALATLGTRVLGTLINRAKPDGETVGYGYYAERSGRHAAPSQRS